MTYRISGLSPEPFRALFGASDAELAARGVRRVRATLLRGASLALADDADARIRELFERSEIAYIHAHNAAHGCYSARVDRS